MLDESFEEQVEKIALKIILCPWTVEKFYSANKYDDDTIYKIVKKYKISYDRSVNKYGAVIFVLSAGIKLKKKYVYQCCAKFLHDDVAKIVVGFLWHPQLFINTKKISYI